MNMRTLLAAVGALFLVMGGVSTAIRKDAKTKVVKDHPLAAIPVVTPVPMSAACLAVSPVPVRKAARRAPARHRVVAIFAAPTQLLTGVLIHALATPMPQYAVEFRSSARAREAAAEVLAVAAAEVLEDVFTGDCFVLSPQRPALVEGRKL